ncbi:MAG: 23S rRNA (pseudouridine(1915)-N(3))-methyltransferase RlmH [Campylobacterota bacterium]|nr:23S rRNA (pseudouridine(1915)-N(3))-methyltransferase RlmH [Campylobacterota bacterium]
MKVNIYSIAKKERSIYDPLYKDMLKMISKFTKIEDVELFPKSVTKAHTVSKSASQTAYSNVLSPHLKGGYCVVLHTDGKIMDSFEFSKLLSDKMAVNFFIGGAYGFEDAFVKKCDKAVSLSNLTMSHKIAKAVLLEQIYRGFSILNNHPYHK